MWVNKEKAKQGSMGLKPTKHNDIGDSWLFAKVVVTTQLLLEYVLCKSMSCFEWNGHKF